MPKGVAKKAAIRVRCTEAQRIEITRRAIQARAISDSAFVLQRVLGDK